MTIRILLTEWAQDWKGAEPQALHSALLDLADQRHLFYLVVSLGNGISRKRVSNANHRRRRNSSSVC